ncbi:MAG: putative toxin-antitoxin system toxin component, PIN family [Caldilineaceae bacterium]|nr:putative toxin-antitoxin system toxin component, PIN family [Caldilineaceae bacterium]
MVIPQVVLDTNILVSGLRSNSGAAYRLLQLVGTQKFDINLSVPLMLEYEDVLYRESLQLPVSRRAIDATLDYHSAVANHHTIYFLWRPFLHDPKDDMVLELAVAANCTYIVTYNQRDFRGIEQFGIKAVTALEFLQIIGERR